MPGAAAPSAESRTSTVADDMASQQRGSGARGAGSHRGKAAGARASGERKHDGRRTTDTPMGHVVRDMPWGTHLCQFYDTKQDLLDILIPYFKFGLENNQFCMWVTAEPLHKGEAREALMQTVVDFDAYEKRGQIEILSHDDWYLDENGLFDRDRVLAGWVDKLNEALAKGYSGMRLTGNTFWLEEDDWAAFTDYEHAVDAVIGDYKMVAI